METSSAANPNRSARLVRIALIGDNRAEVRAHAAIPKMLGLLSASQPGLQFELIWTPTELLSKNAADLKLAQGVWCVPGSPYLNFEGALSGIHFARENNVPFLGTCGGFQHTLIEYARHVLGKPNAEHEESNPAAPLKLISRLACPLIETAGAIFFTAGSRIAAAYGSLRADESYHCNFGLDPNQETLFLNSALKITGRDAEGAARAVELPSHPFYMATLFQPELSAGIHPLIRAFAEAAADAQKTVGL